MQAVCSPSAKVPGSMKQTVVRDEDSRHAVSDSIIINDRPTRGMSQKAGMSRLCPGRR